MITDDSLRLSPEAVNAKLGWALGSEGLCRESVCIPCSPGSSLVDPDGVDLTQLAAILERPIALDLAERIAYLGVPARERSAALASLRAPDRSPEWGVMPGDQSGATSIEWSM